MVDDMVGDFLFDLPENLIAKYPVEPYDHCRLLDVDRQGGKWQERFFYDLPQLLEKDDLLVVNDSRVEARRVFLRRAGSASQKGARIEAVFLKALEDKGDGRLWQALIKKRQRLKDGERLSSEVNPEIVFTVRKFDDERVFLQEPIFLNEAVFNQIGQMPIPPYLKREEEKSDRRAYQNPFKAVGGESVAAPTAALHFTESLKNGLKKRGVQIKALTLDIGYGTFAPLTKENFANERLHEERYSISESLAKTLSEKNYRKIYAVGTTALRALESVYRLTNGRFDGHLSGKTEIFLHPPEKIQSVDGLVTNFHLPGSSLMMLVACLIELPLLRQCYEYAIEKEYRFFSYGDAMFIRN